MANTEMRNPAGWAEEFVKWIACHKAAMLACSIALGGTLAVAALIDVVLGNGRQLTLSVTDAGGYIAIIALVLGIPALGYAMVTDFAVETLAERLGVPEVKLDGMQNLIQQEIDGVLSVWATKLPPKHDVQVFVPNPQRTLLLPAYDPTGTGPDTGWEINEKAPQAVTGSAWVANEYYFALRDALSDPTLRLTPEQLKRYAHLTGVAAAPVHNEHGDRIAVLTIFTDAENPHMAEESFIRLHLALAQAVSPAVSEYIAAQGPLSAPHTTPENAHGHASGAIRSADIAAPRDGT